MKRTIVSLLIFNLFILALYSTETKKPLTHDIYDGWNFLSRQQISADGRWISWEVNPQVGDGWLHFKDLLTGTADSVARGTRASFSPGSEYLAFRIRPQVSVVRQNRVANRRIPRDTLAIVVLETGERILVDRVRSFSTAGTESPWMVYHLHDQPSSGSKNSNGSELVIFNPLSGEKHSFADVNEYSFSGNGRWVAFIQSDRVRVQIENGEDSDSTGKKPQTDLATVRVFDTETQSTTRIRNAIGKAKTISVHDSGQAAFLFAPSVLLNKSSASVSDSTNKASEIWDLWHWHEGSPIARKIVSRESLGMPWGWGVSEHSRVDFTRKGDRIFFGTFEMPQPEPEDTLLREEKYSVDIWHYLDPRLQPQQHTELTRDRRKTYTAVYHIHSDRMVQLADYLMPDVTTTQRGDGRLEIGMSTLPYQLQSSFEADNYSDVYLVDVYTGERRLVLEKYRGSSLRSTRGSAGLSPEGKYLIYYSQADSNWHIMSTMGSEADSNRHALSTSGFSVRNLTADIPEPLYNELHDQPSDPRPHGIAGWTDGDRHVLIYDRHDIWKVDPTGRNNPISLTRGFGRENNIQFLKVFLDDEKETIGRRETILLSAIDNETKREGFYTVRVHRPSRPRRILMDDARYSTPVKAKDSDVLLWTKSCFRTFPDIWVSDTGFGDARRISNANPQQAAYKWGDVRLVEWESYSGQNIQGLLYTPENMEPGRKYPMLVYFYERSSGNLHRHIVPAPSRSIINIPYCVSNDYVVFVPDIPYITGAPGPSAYNAVVSGTEAMIEQFDFIDAGRVGLQGQSWGGYQITWIVTQTDMFRAAMAGAPVSNMTSAYGGIRWSSGLSRIFQYEKTQSRIGASLWEDPRLYFENSPLFYADRVSTPLLMMHNDEDGAVPWYQGIEFFMALRRLGKPVWMLNYNGEAHNLTRRPNMMDLSIRMAQFFDHYLKDDPAPMWLVSGIPAIHKGRLHGYELVE
jgi:dipeptidyl aminopeptidase/acylaminoacyl peptidase